LIDCTNPSFATRRSIAIARLVTRQSNNRITFIIIIIIIIIIIFIIIIVVIVDCYNINNVAVVVFNVVVNWRWCVFSFDAGRWRRH
jgi:hypothetical protein